MSFASPPPSDSDSASLDHDNPYFSDFEQDSGEEFGDDDYQSQPIYSHLQDLASELSHDYIASRRQLKRPSPYQLAGDTPSKFKKSSSDYVSWSSSVIEEIEKLDEMHKGLADQGKSLHRIASPDVKRR